MTPSYLHLYQSGELQERIDKAFKLLPSCSLCPHNCGVDRLSNEKGICNTGKHIPVASYSPHFGEEAPLVGQNGSGTIFFGSCNLLCTFCQNYDISHIEAGEVSQCTMEQLAEVMLRLQRKGCHNLNLVSPSHVVPQILDALSIAVSKGFNLPLVYNTSGYDSIETLEILNGVVDIYMPDFKFWYNETAKQYTRAEDYGDVVRNAVKTMYEQVGNLVTDENTIATRGLLVRHLVMPGYLHETEKILNFLSEEISPTCHVNIMDQYRPCGKAEVPIDRCLTGEEFQQALDLADKTDLVQLNKKSLSELLRKLGLKLE